MRHLIEAVPDKIHTVLADCQSASNIAPLSASKNDPPLWRRARTAAIAPAELVRVAQPGRARVGEELFLGRSGAVLEAPAFVAGLDDVTVMGEAIEERGRHLWVAEDARPFAEGEVGGDHD